MAVRVFLVEDMKPMREALCDLLDSMEGFEVVGVAATETDATDWLLRHAGGWDLAIFDLLLAEGSGFTLLSRCQKALGGAVVVFSEFVTPVLRDRCLHLGADAVIAKSQFEQLRAYLQDFPGRRVSDEQVA